MVDSVLIRSRFALLSPHLDERGRRLFAASKARAACHGGIAAAATLTVPDGTAFKAGTPRQ